MIGVKIIRQFRSYISFSRRNTGKTTYVGFAYDVRKRLSELKELPEGWLGGAGKRLDSDRVDWLAKELDGGYPSELPLPRIYPTEDGNVRMEWLFEPTDVSVDIDLAFSIAYLHLLNLQTDEERSDKFDLQSMDGWQALFDKLESVRSGL